MYRQRGGWGQPPYADLRLILRPFLGHSKAIHRFLGPSYDVAYLY